MQIVILTYYARNPLLICPMGFVFSLYYYYIGQFVKIENIAILELRACQNCTFREAYFVQQDNLIFGLSNCHSWCWRHGSNCLCSTLAVCTAKAMRIYELSLVTLKILYFPTVYTVL